MSAVVGIDLGTTNTVVGHVEGGRGTALADETGATLLPSVVSFHPNGEVLVGRPARDRRIVDARNTVFSTKRLIGRAWDTEEVQKARARLPFELREGPGQGALVVARGETYTLPEISAYVLRKAKAIAEGALGEPVDRAVVTVPANFNDLQRAATKVAGRVAGLEVLRILNEPTAAALAYGFGRGTTERIAVYDLGGGTCDVTLLDLSANVFEVLATAGDMFLGGDDFDTAIAQKICDACLRTHRIDPRADPQSFERARMAAEDIKMRLSKETFAEIQIPEIGYAPGGKPILLTFRMTRDELEQIIEPFVARSFAVCEEALRTARVPRTSFDQIILVGGSTRIPAIRARVADFFGKEPLAHINPDEVVGIGASIQAMALTATEKRGRGPGDKVKTFDGLGAMAEEAKRRSSPNLNPESQAKLSTTGLTPDTHPGIGAPHPDTTRGLGSGRGRNDGGGIEHAIVVPGPGKGRASSPNLDADPMTPMYIPQPDPFSEEPLRPMTPRKPPPPPAGARRGPGAPTYPSVADEARAALDEKTKVHDVTGLIEESRSSHRPPLPPMRTPQGTIAGVAPPPMTADVGNRTAAMASVHPPPAPVDFGNRTAAMPAIQMPVQATARTQQANVYQAPIPLVYPTPQSAPPMPAPVNRPSSMPPPQVPLLLDVTPHSLTVETVGGYCDVLVARSTPIPCQRERAFVNAMTDQTTVKVRVAQGESARFGDNTLLGEVELTGLRKGRRGEVEIAVSFQIDADGILHVRARDLGTGHEARATLRLVASFDAGALALRQLGHAVV